MGLITKTVRRLIGSRETKRPRVEPPSQHPSPTRDSGISLHVCEQCATPLPPDALRTHDGHYLCGDHKQQHFAPDAD